MKSTDRVSRRDIIIVLTTFRVPFILDAGGFSDKHNEVGMLLLSYVCILRDSHLSFSLMERADSIPSSSTGRELPSSSFPSSSSTNVFTDPRPPLLEYDKVKRNSPSSGSSARIFLDKMYISLHSIKSIVSIQK